MDDGVNDGGPTDRLLAVWDVQAAPPGPPPPDGAAIALEESAAACRCHGRCPRTPPSSRWPPHLTSRPCGAPIRHSPPRGGSRVRDALAAADGDGDGGRFHPRRELPRAPPDRPRVTPRARRRTHWQDHHVGHRRFQVSSSQPEQQQPLRTDVVVLGGGPPGENVAGRVRAAAWSASSSRASSSAASARTGPASRARRCCARWSSRPRRPGCPGVPTGTVDAQAVLKRRDWFTGYDGHRHDDTGQQDWVEGTGTVRRPRIRPPRRPPPGRGRARGRHPDADRGASGRRPRGRQRRCRPAGARPARGEAVDEPGGHQRRAGARSGWWSSAAASSRARWPRPTGASAPARSPSWSSRTGCSAGTSPTRAR